VFVAILLYRLHESGSGDVASKKAKLMTESANSDKLSAKPASLSRQ